MIGNEGAVDPNLAALDRQRAQLGAASPLRSTADQAGHADLPMFAATGQPQLFALAETIRDGEVAPQLRSAGDILAALDADDAAIAATRECLE